MRARPAVGRPTTLADVARAAVVSPATASRALGGSPLVRPDTRERVRGLASAVGLRDTKLDTRVAEATPLTVARVRLARALALNPTLLLAEHPSASLPRDDVKAFAADIAHAATERKLGVLAITGDVAFARGLGGMVLIHQPATGALQKPGLWQRIFNSLL